MPRLILIRDFFAPYRREIIPISPGRMLCDYIPSNFRADKAQVIRNGETQKRRDTLDIVVLDGDEFILRVVPGAFIFTAAFYIPLLLSVVLSTASYFINKALAPKVENKKNYDNTEESPTYGWDGIQNTMRNGEPIGLVFGKHRIAGQYLSALTKSPEEGKNYLYLLIGIGAGPLGGINNYAEDASSLTSADISSDMLINNNSGDAFEGLEVSYRMGNWDQGTIAGFRDAGYTDNVSTELTYNNAYTYTTTGNVQEIDLIFAFHGGLYKTDESASFLDYSVDFAIRYKEYGTDTWTSLDTTTITARTRSTYRKYVTISDLDAARYVVEITRSTADDGSYTMSASTIESVALKTYDDVAYHGVACVGLKALATEQLNGRIPTVTNIVYGIECNVYHPNDEFGEDTEQDFRITSTASGKRLWGWNVANFNKVALAKTHTVTAGKLHVLHLGSTHGSGAYRSQWSGGTETAPRFYKKLYGDFTASVKMEFVGDHWPNYGMGAALIMKPQYRDESAYIGMQYDGTDYEWIAYDNMSYRDETTTGTLSATSTLYCKIEKDADTFTLSTSADGTTWTTRDTITFTMPTYSEYMEVGMIVWSSAGVYQTEVLFDDFTVTGDDCYSVETTSNPAWVLYYCLTNTRYGLGNYFAESSVDLDTFIDFADYCNGQVNNARGGTHRRYRFDGVIDDSPAAWDKLVELANTYRATLLQQGDRVRVAWQCVKSPVQLFSIANIKEGSFVLSYETNKLRTNYWEMQYLNAENNYEQDYAVYIDPDLEAGEPYRRKTTPIYGVTRPAEANRAALFLCKYNHHVTRQVSFETGIEAICCEPYDVISVSHDVPAWGVGAGRVIQSTETGITLDKQITLESGYTYVVKIRHKSDEYETQTITTTAGDVWAIDVASWTKRPEPSAVWVVGKSGVAVKDFLVTDITRTKDLECKVDGIEYVEDVYDDEVTSIPEVVYTELPDPRKKPGDIPQTSLALAERAQVMPDGHVQNVIDVTWASVSDAANYEIWYKEGASGRWQYSGFSRDIHHVINAVFTKGYTYWVTVVPVGPWGAKKHPSQTPIRSITIVGRTTRPADVSSITVHEGRGIVIIKWTAVSDADILGYELRYSMADDWSRATILTSGIPTTEYSTSEYVPGTYYFMVKAINRSGLYSATAASVQETLAGPDDESVTVSRDEVVEGWDGTKTNMTVVSTDLVTDAGETTCTYETPEIDAGSSVTARVVCDVTCAEQTLADMTMGTLGAYTLGSAWAQNTYMDTVEDAQVDFQISYRAGDVSESLGAYATITANYDLNVQLTGRYYQIKVAVTPGSASYQGVLSGMTTEIREY